MVMFLYACISQQLVFSFIYRHSLIVYASMLYAVCRVCMDIGRHIWFSNFFEQKRNKKKPTKRLKSSWHDDTHILCIRKCEINCTWTVHQSQSISPSLWSYLISDVCISVCL